MVNMLSSYVPAFSGATEAEVGVRVGVRTGVFVGWLETLVFVGPDGVREGVVEGVKRGVKVRVGVREGAIKPGVEVLALVPNTMIGAPEVFPAAVWATDEEEVVEEEDEEFDDEPDPVPLCKPCCAVIAKPGLAELGEPEDPEPSGKFGPGVTTSAVEIPGSVPSRTYWKGVDVWVRRISARGELSLPISKTRHIPKSESAPSPIGKRVFKSGEGFLSIRKFHAVS